MMRKTIAFVIALVVSFSTHAQVQSLQKKLEKLVADKALELGFACYDFTTGDALSISGSRRFPMQSVFKFPIALTMLHEVDNGAFGLQQKIYIGKEDLRPGLWSPIEKAHPGGNIQLPLSEIIKQTVAQSDNVGCDLLLKLLGGPTFVNKHIHNQGITDISIRNNEQEIQSSWHVQFDNWTTPNAMIQLLQLFKAQKLLQADSHAFLWNIMAETSTGFMRKKLPSDAVIVHKTGHSGYNAEKVSAATNDVGIMQLPGGKQIAFAIFITNAKEPSEVIAEVIADIAALLYSLK